MNQHLNHKQLQLFDKRSVPLPTTKVKTVRRRKTSKPRSPLQLNVLNAVNRRHKLRSLIKQIIILETACAGDGAQFAPVYKAINASLLTKIHTAYNKKRAYILMQTTLSKPSK